MSWRCVCINNGPLKARNMLSSCKQNRQLYWNWMTLLCIIEYIIHGVLMLKICLSNHRFLPIEREYQSQWTTQNRKPRLQNTSSTPLRVLLFSMIQIPSFLYSQNFSQLKPHLRRNLGQLLISITWGRRESIATFAYTSLLSATCQAVGLLREQTIIRQYFHIVFLVSVYQPVIFDSWYKAVRNKQMI